MNAKEPDSNRARIPYPDLEQAPAAVQALLKARPPRNVFRMIAHASAFVPGLMELTGAILYKATLDPRLRELAILRVGHLCGSIYEVHQHRKIAQAIRVQAAKITATERDADPDVYDTRELLVLRMTEQVVRNYRADDELMREAAAQFGYEQTMELLIIIGTYIMLAAVLESTGVELEAEEGPAQQDVERIFARQIDRK